ncbi:hypothetical protein [Patulibacter defluvii]|uniref:hypothetical protein n=1 Tax=Patulibacter defluvii TaxID=3095358 RepID=UPI002A751092|nr:hypothetical protein [Patulibacter sp. DM4]
MNLIDEFQKQIDERMAELRPLVDEFHALQQLRKAIETLDPEAAAEHVSAFPLPGSTAANAAAAAAAAAAQAAPKASTAKPRAARGTKRPAKAAPRAAAAPAAVADPGALHSDDAVAQITAEPGLTANQLAEKMEVPVNVLFRLLPQLQREGRIRKQGKGYLPA